MRRENNVGYSLEVLVRPGQTLSAARLRALTDELRACATASFGIEAPDYQALSGRKQDLERAVIGLARRPDGTLAAFSACVLLPVEGIGDVFHLGLTCVAPEDRSGGLTHRLLARTCLTYLLQARPLGSVWVSNVACVLSSLGNVALHFDDVHPSPFREAAPSADHLRIAEAIATHHRELVAIHPAAVLDPATFVMRGSVPGTVFEKRECDTRYHHRNKQLNAWYTSRIDFERGDEVIQVGRMSALGALRHLVKRTFGIKPRFAPSSPVRAADLAAASR